MSHKNPQDPVVSAPGPKPEQQTPPPSPPAEPPKTVTLPETELTQLKADVLGRPITALAVTEAGCLGVAMLACAARTGAKPQHLADTWVQTAAVVEPDPGRARQYDEKFAAYKELYPAMRQYYRGHNAI